MKHIMQHLNIIVYGTVQGVGFRRAAIQKARHLNITGFIRNETDGSVFIEAEGNRSGLAGFVEWCKTGPVYADVKEVKVKEESLKNYTSFDPGY